MRDADIIPECFQRLGGFDRDAVERFFAARRDVILDSSEAPLIPLGRLPPLVQARWRQYLAEKAARETPLNGVQASSGKIAARQSVFDEILASGVAKLEANNRDTKVFVTETPAVPAVRTVFNPESLARTTLNIAESVTKTPETGGNAPKHGVETNTQPVTVTKKGRPKKEGALSPAERQRASRERRKLTLDDLRKAADAEPE